MSDITDTAYQIPEDEMMGISTSNSSNIIFCPFCGESNYISFKFCWQCGKEI